MILILTLFAVRGDAEFNTEIRLVCVFNLFKIIGSTFDGILYVRCCVLPFIYLIIAIP